MARQIDITLEGLHQLLHRIERKELVDGDWAICASLVLQLILRMQGKQERMAAKLAATGGAASANVVDALPVASSALPALPPGPSPEPPTSQGSDVGTPASKNAKGHGRNGASAFVNAKHFIHALAVGVVGALCSACGLGRLTRYREKVVIRVVGQPLFAAQLHHLEQARCRECGRVVRAQAPTSVTEGVGSSYAVYDWSACAMLVVMHYFAAAPFKRLESLHAGWGIPMPDANLWRMADETDDLLLPLYRAVELHGVQKATSLRIDDTGSMVVALAREIQAEMAALKLAGESTKNVRTGINATGVLLETADGNIVLFFTGRHHAGEVLDQLLKRRIPGGPRLVKVTDGASKNFDHQHRGELVEATCNAHAFLKFHDIKEEHPAEYAVAGEVYKGVFDNDDEAKARRLTPDERMLFHRERSKSLMEKLKAMCEEKLRSKLVEPSSALWEPLSFIINQWPRLTRFYEEPGVPLDTNLVEQKLIIPVRYLAASFNYKTETGAEVGDRMMSLIATAHANGVEPVAYLTHCLRHHEELSKRPADFLPWAYREREGLRSSTGPPATAAPANG
jgi:hypothetical protein